MARRSKKDERKAAELSPQETLELARINARKVAYIAQLAASTVQLLIRALAITAFMYCVFLTIQSLAGKQTDASIIIDGRWNVRLLANRYMAALVFGIFGAGGIGYGIKYKRLYRQTCEKLRRVEKYERLHDPTRSGSGLTDGSRPNPEDIV